MFVIDSGNTSRKDCTARCRCPLRAYSCRSCIASSNSGFDAVDSSSARYCSTRSFETQQFVNFTERWSRRSNFHIAPALQPDDPNWPGTTGCQATRTESSFVGVRCTQMAVEWDPAKARTNFRKHGIRFADAVSALKTTSRFRYVTTMGTRSAGSQSAWISSPGSWWSYTRGEMRMCG